MMRSDGDRPLISVIVPVLGDSPHLDTCLAALTSQEEVRGGVEIIVVDNGSDPPVLNRWGARCTLLREEVRGSYAARNAGLRVARGDWLAFTDADCMPRTSWLRAGLDVLARESRTIVVGDVHTTVSRNPSMAERFDEAFAFPVERYVAQGYGITANLLIARTLLVELGGFDGGLQSGGDRDLCERAVEAGARLVYAPAAVVDHPARTTIGELASKQRRVTRGATLLRVRRGATRVELLASALWSLRPPLRVLFGPHGSRRWGLAAIDWYLKLVTARELIAAGLRPGRDPA